MTKGSVAIVVILIILAGFGYYLYTASQKRVTTPASNVATPTQPSSTTNTNQPEGPDIEIVAQNLQIPWEVAFLPTGELLVTERPGKLLKLNRADKTTIEISGVAHVGEGGLLGLALHPDFEHNNLLYLYLTTRDGGSLVNKVERYKLAGNSLTDRQVILEGIKGAANHDGGRLEFGPDGYLYVTTGDAQQPQFAQDQNSLNGKILRIKDDGSIPEDNPFKNAVWSYGHRNVQGLAWDDAGHLWATEHGRSGALSGYDELNLIVRGQNYGWPDIQGNQEKTGMFTPIINSGATETWAPSGAQYLDGSIYFAGLRGATLYQAKIVSGNVTKLSKHFTNQYGRLRTVKLGPDGYLYIATSNQDGRGKPNSDDDKIIRVNPKVLN